MATTLSLFGTSSISCKPLSTLPSSKLQLTHCNPTHLTTCRSTPKKDHIEEPIHTLKSASLAALYAITLLFLLDTNDALTVGGEFGILEGRSVALIHPIMMDGLFAYLVWAGYLGLQWRRVRTTQDEINELKKQVKPVVVTPDGTPPDPSPPLPIQAQIQQLTEVLATIETSL